MTHRERVVTALNHQEPDRVPMDLSGTLVTGITRIAYRNLLKHLGDDREELPVFDPIQQLATVHEDILQRFEVDFRNVPNQPPSTWQPDYHDENGYHCFTDQWGIGWRMPRDRGLYYDMYKHPLAGATLDGLARYQWPDPLDPGRREGLAAQAQALFASTDCAIVHGWGFGAGFLEQCVWAQGFEDGLANLVADEQLTHRFLETVMERNIQYADVVLDEIGPYIHIWGFGDDLGHQDSPMFGVAMFRTYLKDRYTRFFAAIKRKAPHVKVFFHTCGSVYDFVPDLIETGIDILNPVQVSAARMDPGRLKREFGDALAFWGGIDTHHVLPHGTPQQVRDEVRRRIEELAPGGGYVLNSVHNIQADVPPANVVAMFEAGLEYGGY